MSVNNCVCNLFLLHMCMSWIFIANVYVCLSIPAWAAVTEVECDSGVEWRGFLLQVGT